MNTRYTLRPNSNLPLIYVYRQSVDFRNYALNIVMR